MIRAGVAVEAVEAGSARAAGERAVARALGSAGLARADAAWLAVTAACGAEAATVAWGALDALATAGRGQAPIVAGSTVEAVLAEGRDRVAEPCVMVLALEGVEAQSLLLDDAAGHEDRVGAELASAVGGPFREGDLALLWPDAQSLVGDRLLDGLADELGPARALGVGAAGISGGPSLAWSGSEEAAGGLAALVLRPEQPPRLRTTHGCRPVTPVLEVTRARGHWIRRLAGRPALDVYREAARAPLAADLARAARFLKVGLVSDDEPLGRPEQFAIRDVVGFDERSGALSIPEPMASGRRLVLLLHDPDTARTDMKVHLDALAHSPPVAALYLGCRARGEALFGVSGIEAGYLARAFPGVPVAGALGPYLIVPGRGSRPDRVTYTSVIATIDDEGPCKDVPRDLECSD